MTPLPIFARILEVPPYASLSDIDTYDTQIAILNHVAEEMHKKGRHN